MQTRLSNPKTIKFRSDLGFNQINLILKKEQSVVITLLKAFSQKTSQKMKEQELTCIFPSINLLQKQTKRVILTEIKMKKKKKYKQKQKSILIASFFQDIFLEISEIQNQITKSNENKKQICQKIIDLCFQNF